MDDIQITTTEKNADDLKAALVNLITAVETLKPIISFAGIPIIVKLIQAIDQADIVAEPKK